MSFITSKVRSLFHSLHTTRGQSCGVVGDVNARSVANNELESNSNTTANKLVDKFLDYLRENYCKQIDPFVTDTNFKLKPRKYGMNCQKKPSLSINFNHFDGFSRLKNE